MAKYGARSVCGVVRCEAKAMRANVRSMKLIVGFVCCEIFCSVSLRNFTDLQVALYR